MIPTIMVTGERDNWGDRYARLDTVAGKLPPALADVHGVWSFGPYNCLIKLTESRESAKVDFTLLGVVLDLCRDAGFTVDLSKVPGWKDKGIGS